MTQPIKMSNSVDTNKLTPEIRLKLWAKQNPTHPISNDILRVLQDLSCLSLDYERDVLSHEEKD